MILNNKDISKNDFFNKIVPLDKHFEQYFTNYILPKAVAFYLKESYYRKCLCDSSIDNYINSTIELINNFDLNFSKLIPKIEEILLIKYNLKVANIDQLRLKINTK